MADPKTRAAIVGASNAQALSDYQSILTTCDDIRSSFAAGDIFACGSVPFLKHGRPPPKSNSWIDGPQLTCNMKQGTIKFHRNVHRPKLSAQEKTKMENAKITESFEMLTMLKKTVDSSRIYFDVAVIYEEIQMFDRAIKFYDKATRRIPSDRYIDEELLPDTKEHRRKVERLGKAQLKKYLEDRAAKRAELLLFENTQRRFRALLAHCALFKLYIFTEKEYDRAHFHMREAFETCVNDAEHGELLHYFHAYLAHFCMSGAQEIAIEHQIIHSNGGALAEAHISILDDLLLREKPTNPIYFEWLGKRWAERSEFEISRGYYKQARDIKKEDLTMDVALTMWTLVGQPKKKKGGVGLPPLPEGTTAGNSMKVSGGATNGAFGGIVDTATDVEDAELLRAINKDPVICYEKDSDVDHEANATRDDFTTYGKKHEASTTVLYKIPTQGWGPSTEAQLRRLQILRQVTKMPPMSAELDEKSHKQLENVKYENVK